MSKFKVIIADPPWTFDDSLGGSAGMQDRRPGRKRTVRGASAKYETMPEREISGIPVAHWCAADAVLALWTPAAMLFDGLSVMSNWGFRHTQIVVWVKRTINGKMNFGMGNYFRGAAEFVLFGVRGAPPPPKSRSERNVFEAPVLGHSVKPDCLHAALARMYPGGPFLELFARRSVPCWTCVGLECEGPGAIKADLRTWSLAT